MKIFGWTIAIIISLFLLAIFGWAFVICIVVALALANMDEGDWLWILLIAPLFGSKSKRRH
jgi:hypothetical protein